MSSNAVEWTWSEAHSDYYYVTQDSAGMHRYHWSKQQSVAPQIASIPQSTPYAHPQAQAAYPASQHTYPPAQSTNTHTPGPYLAPENAHSASQGPYYSSAQTPYAATYGYPHAPPHNSHARVDSGSYHHGHVQNHVSSQLASSTPRAANAGHGNAHGGAQSVGQPGVSESQSTGGRLSDHIVGTPGDHERLDSTYFMRSGHAAREFFKRGQVFAMLYSEAASETIARGGHDNDAVTVVKFQEHVYSQIRRFVVVHVNQGFVYACAISTYSNRGTLKPGCNPTEHTIVHFSNTDPVYLQGEWDAGMTKDPIMIRPAEQGMIMSHASRLRFGKTYSIEMNVKVKNIGRVESQSMSPLITYWSEAWRAMFST